MSQSSPYAETKVDKIVSLEVAINTKDSTESGSVGKGKEQQQRTNF